MGTITIFLSDKTEKKLRRLAKGKYSDSEESLAKIIEDGLDVLEKEWVRQEAHNRLIARMKKGYNLGGFKLKSRDEIYDRFERK